MKVLIVGSGGREHTLAWKLAQSDKHPKLYFAPGNVGMSDLGELVDLAVDDVRGITQFAMEKNIDLVVIGPEAALEAGVSDSLRSSGIVVFGPSKAAAQLETSKAFAKHFMRKFNIPTARYEVFDDYPSALEHLAIVDYPVVIKASGLAAGKGVLLPETKIEAEQILHMMMEEKTFGEAGNQVVIEERLSGPEVSVLAFSDGKSLALMPCAQDHKRLLDDDLGPNTGGMGTYAPAPILDDIQLKEIEHRILQPAIDGLRAMGNPYVGVLYAGLMLTSQGIRVLEFNARFGDPETQVILPLLDSDLLEILLACTQERLSDMKIHWQEKSAVCVVLASAGYPGKSHTGFPIQGLDQPLDNGMVFHAGTGRKDDEIVNTGGRVLGVTCWDENLEMAIKKTYQAVEKIQFSGMQCRKDIGKKGLISQAKSGAYQAAGVDIDAGNRAVELMKNAVQSTFTPHVLSQVGSFGGLFDISHLKKENVLVASTDGVGTKVELAARTGRYASIGEDIVNHCVNDILVQGATPLFFLDYFATAKLNPEIVAAIVSGMAKACKENGCALLGGETAEMLGVYTEGSFDVAGTIVGAVRYADILPQKALMAAGDLLIGFPSSGPHTNGYSLIRKLCEGEDLQIHRPELEMSLADALLAPHRSYLSLLQPHLHKMKGLAHITGGGFIENIPRVVPEHLHIVIEKSTWQVPHIFQWLQRKGNISTEEMYRVFNMGIGMVAIIDAGEVDYFQNALDGAFSIIGYLSAKQPQKVVLK